MDPEAQMKEWEAERAHAFMTVKEILTVADAEKRQLTSDEQKRCDDLTATGKGLERKIADCLAAQEKRRALDAEMAAFNAPIARRTDPPAISTVENAPACRAFEIPSHLRHRTGALKAFKGPDAERNAFIAGQWALSAIYGKQDATRWMRDNYSRAASENINTAGGALVPEEMAQTIIDLREEYGIFRQNCKVETMTSDTKLIARRVSGLTGYWTGEGAETTASQKAWNQVRLTVKKLSGLSLFSNELAEDAVINIGDDLAKELAYMFAVSEDEAGFNGDGTSAYGGIVGILNALIDGTHTAGMVEPATSTHDLFTEIDAADLTKVMAALPQYAWRNAKWYISQTGYASVFQRLMAAGGGNNLLTLAGKPQQSYLGYPVVISQSMPVVSTSLDNKIMLLFGDLSLAATLGDRRGIRLFASEHRYMEYDQIGVIGTERVDIVSHDLGNTSVAGPIVGLNGSIS